MIEPNAVEFVTDEKGYDVTLDYDAQTVERQKIWETLGFKARWIGDGIFCMELIQVTEAQAREGAAWMLQDAGYLVKNITQDGGIVEIYFGLPAPKDLWKRGSRFRLEGIWLSNGLQGEARECAFERKISALLDEGWEVHSLHRYEDHLEMALILPKLLEDWN